MFRTVRITRLYPGRKCKETVRRNAGRRGAHFSSGMQEQGADRPPERRAARIFFRSWARLRQLRRLAPASPFQRNGYFSACPTGRRPLLAPASLSFPTCPARGTPVQRTLSIGGPLCPIPKAKTDFPSPAAIRRSGINHNHRPYRWFVRASFLPTTSEPTDSSHSFCCMARPAAIQIPVECSSFIWFSFAAAPSADLGAVPRFARIPF